MLLRACLSTLVYAQAWCVPAWCAPAACQASPEILAEFEKAASVSAAVTDLFSALEKAEPFRILCERYPDDLFVHEKYQDAIHEFGIEGHLQLLTKQYNMLEDQHPNDPIYRYLSLRTTVGRSTPQAILGLEELLQAHPDFAPAHRTLAEIHGTEAYRDPEKELLEREKFLARCPMGTFTRRPPPVPAPTTLLEQAERRLAAGEEPDRVLAMIHQGLQEREWRSQRIRAFDWYSLESKRQDARELRAQYWKAWPTQVRSFRKAGRLQEARQVLAAMERSLLRMPVPRMWDPLYTLAQLYAEDAETAAQANRKLDRLRQLARQDSDPVERDLHATQIEKLRQLLPSAGN